MTLGDEKYIALTTFKRDGSPVTTPVWIVALGDHTVGFWTSSGSGKAKRLARTARVIVQPSDARGRVKPGTEPIDASAQVVEGSELDEIRVKVRAKYGAMTTVSKVLGAIGGLVKRKRIPYGDRGVVITLT